MSRTAETWSRPGAAAENEVAVQPTVAPAASDVFERRGSMELRLARTPGEVAAAQALRYRVFYEEMSAQADESTRSSRRDADRFDEFCDHLLVIDHALYADNDDPDGEAPEQAVVGCYRLLRQEVAEAHGGFYTAGEYEIGPDESLIGSPGSPPAR